MTKASMRSIDLFWIAGCSISGWDSSRFFAPSVINVLPLWEARATDRSLISFS